MIGYTSMVEAKDSDWTCQLLKYEYKLLETQSCEHLPASLIKSCFKLVFNLLNSRE